MFAVGQIVFLLYPYLSKKSVAFPFKKMEELLPLLPVPSLLCDDPLGLVLFFCVSQLISLGLGLGTSLVTCHVRLSPED